MRNLVALISCLFVPVLLASGNPYIWNGAGARDAGETPIEELDFDNLWSNLDNWLVDGDVPEELPGLGDDVIINMTFTSPFSKEMVITNGAEARHVEISGLSQNNREIELDANANVTFSTLYSDSGNSAGVLFSLTQTATLTITGGELPSTENPEGRFSLGTNPSSNNRSPITGSGQLIFTNDEVFIRINGTSKNLEITTPGAVVDGAGWSFSLSGGTVVGQARFRSDQTIQNLPGLRFGRAANLQSITGDPLDNFGGVTLFSDTRYGDGGDIPGGTYNALMVSGGAGGGGNPRFTAGDRLFVVGTEASDQILEMAAIFIGRANESNVSTLELEGNNLTVTGGGAIVVGHDPSESTWGGRALLDAEGSTVETDGSVVFYERGYIHGNGATELNVASDFLVYSDENEEFNLAASTLRLVGSGSLETPQLLEVAGADLGAVAAGLVDNFAIGRLEIGSDDEGGETYVQLIDEYDFSGNGADALYLTELWVSEGSVLDLNFLSVYVDEELVTPGSGEYGPGLIVIPEAKQFALMLGLGLLVFGVRRVWKRRG